MQPLFLIFLNFFKKFFADHFAPLEQAFFL